LHREAVVTGLGRGVDANRRFDPERLAETLAVVAGFAETARSLGVDRIGAVATSASRDAVNGGELLDGVQARAGVRPQIVSGREEAALSFAGATSGVPGPGPHLVIDIGGGSTEFVYGSRHPEYAVSVDIGSVRITERAVPSRPAPSAEIDAARELADRLFATVALPGPPQTVIGVAGTFTSLAAMDSGLAAYERDVVEGYELDGADLAALVDRLGGLTVEETAAIPALDPRRAPVILGGAIVAGRALAAAGADRLTVSEHDLLDGLAMRLLG
ncbi:MAG: Ppx/GppA family phosphatase, partial [Actinobacteria bacterium]